MTKSSDKVIRHMSKKTIRKEIPIALSSNYMTQLTNESGGGRRYEVDGAKYESVTSIISNNLRNFGVERWKDSWIKSQLSRYNSQTLTPQIATDIVSASTDEMNASADLGTQMHTIIEGLLRDESVDHLITDQLEPAVRAWLNWRREFINWELVGTEVGVYTPRPVEIRFVDDKDASYASSKLVFEDDPPETDSRKLPYYAGQVDALFKNNNSYMVVDWKTSSGLYESSYLQVAAYAKALKEMHYREKWGAFGPNLSVDGRYTPPLRDDVMEDVSACVVRLVNDYPRDQDGKKDRTQAKVFSGGCEYVMVDVDHWGKTFQGIVDTSIQLKNKVKKERIFSYVG